MARPATRADDDALRLAAAGGSSTAELCIARVRLRAAMRAAWLHYLWRQDGRDDAPALSRITEDRDRPELELDWRAAQAELAPLRAELEQVESALDHDATSPLAHLRAIFGLDGNAMDLVHLTLAYALDEGLAPVLRHLGGDAEVAHPTPFLAARLFARAGTGSARALPWRRDAPVARWQLVACDGRDPASARLTMDEGIRDWLAGAPLGDTDLAGIVSAAACPEPLPEWPVDPVAADVERMVQHEGRQPVQVQVSAIAGMGRQSFAATVARRLGLGLLVVDVDRAPAAGAEEPASLLAVRVHRQAFINGAAIAWRSGRARVPVLPADLVPFPVEFALIGPGRRMAPVPGRVAIPVRLSAPDCDTRLGLWRQHLPECAAWDGAELGRLAARHRASPGRIAAAAVQRPGSPTAAGKLVSRLDRHRFATLAEHLPGPFLREDLVVPPRLGEQLETLIHEAHCRARFWEGAAARRLFPRGRGLTALFTGAPGTGKTMAAQVVARELELDLFRVDLSAVVSKYIGETAENIEHILAEAAATDVVLLFDEADGLFARRTDVSDAHDRYANTDTGHLLQAIEGHDGIVILASNRRRNIDEAFLRRLRYVLEFPAPDDEARLAIWRKVVGELGGEACLHAVAPVLERIAHRVTITGAQIKHAVLTALFSAERGAESLAARHLLIGVDAELMKEGRALSERDRAQLGSAP